MSKDSCVRSDNLNMKENKTKNNKTKNFEAEKYIKFIVIGLIALFVVSFGLYLVLRNTATYVAKVGEERISEAEFVIYLEQIKERMIAAAGEDVNPNTFWETKIDNKSALEVAKDQALEAARQQKVLLIKAREAGVSLTDEERKIIDDYFGNGLKAQYGTMGAARKAIETQTGMTLAQFKEFFIENQIINKFQSEKISAIEVTEAEFEDYYNNNPDIFKKSALRPEGEEAVWVKHVLIPTIDLESGEELSAEEVEKALQTAQEVLSKARSGEDFAALAQEYSADNNASQGGDYVFTKGIMDSAFEEAAFALEPGEISEPVKTQFGYHIIKLEEKISEGQPVSIRCAREYFEYDGMTMLVYEKYSQMVEEWTKDYEIEIYESAYNKI